LDGWNWLPAPQASASLASGSLGALFVRLMLNGCGGEAQTERLVSAFRADAYVVRSASPSGARQLVWSTRWTSPETAAAAQRMLRRCPQTGPWTSLVGAEARMRIRGSVLWVIKGGSTAEGEAAEAALPDDDLRPRLGGRPLGEIRI